jgi:hypothetical protein
MARKAKRREKECLAKAGYPKRDDAEIHIREAVRRGRLVEGECYAYRCNWCSGWHIGHPSKAVAERTALRLAKKMARAA